MFRSVSRRLVRYATPAAVAAFGVLAITSLTLFVRPIIGMADNGDYFRILYSNGLYISAPDYDQQYLGYFVKQYGIFQYFNENSAAIFSSQSLFIRMAIVLNKWIFSDLWFDIRFQAAIYTALYVAAVYLLVEALTWRLPRKRGYIIAGIAIFLFADTAYTAYFNSFYGESIVWIMTMFVLASSLLLWRKRYNDYVMMAIFVISALILTTSKQQNAPVGLIAAVLGMWLVFIRSGKTHRLLIWAALAGLFMVGIGTYALIPKEFVNINKYHAMTRGVLLYSEDPEATLEDFKIDPQYAMLNGTIHYLPYTTVDVDSKLLEENFYSKYGFGSILKHYLTHPGQAVKMLNMAARNGFTIRPPAMGNFEKSEGREFGAHTSFFSEYSLLKDALAPKTFGFVVIWMAVVIGMYMPAFVQAVRKRNARQQLQLGAVLMMMSMGLSGVLVSIIGAGDADLAKHLFHFTATFDLVSFMLVADLIGRRLWNARLEEQANVEGRQGYEGRLQHATSAQAESGKAG